MQDLHFPKAGVDLSQGFTKQPNRPVTNGEYARTTPIGNNVRGYEPKTNRMRGGSRTGLSKYLPGQVAGTLWIVQELNTLVGTGYPPPGGTGMQLSNAGRVVTLVAVSQGNVFVASPGDTVWRSTINNTGETPPLNYSGIMYSAANNQKLWFADGINYAYYDPGTNTVQKWTASSGTLPVDSQNNTPRLIANWRGRIVLSGLILDPQDWFMSAVNDPTNWNYNPASAAGGVIPTQAIAGINAPQGLVGDVVTALIPYNDDVLIFGGDHTIYMMQGDPMSGGQIDLVSDIIGMAWGQAWCKDPYGNIYFVSNRTGIYTLIPGQQPQRISQPIEQLLGPINTGTYSIRLVWNDRFQGLHVFVTLLSAPAAATHFFFEVRSGAWWTDSFANNNLNPLCCTILDGNNPGDRVALIGSWDGYVRAIDPSATTDDGTAITSSVYIGPLTARMLEDLMCKDLQAVLGANSGTVTYNVYTGSSAEVALSSTPVASGTWTAGRNTLSFVRRSGHSLYVQLTSTNPWQMESIRARMQELGKVRQRGF